LSTKDRNKGLQFICLQPWAISQKLVKNRHSRFDVAQGRSAHVRNPQQLACGHFLKLLKRPYPLVEQSVA